MRVSVVIVTYNGLALLRRCLRSLANQSRPADEIIVVDNGSTDGTTTVIPEEFPTVDLIVAGRNLGFAVGNNLGIVRSSGQVVVLMNNDTVATPEFLAEIVRPIQSDPLVGSVASAMVFSRAPTIVASAGIAIYRNGLALDQALGMPLTALRDDTLVFGASAGAAAYRKAALDQVGMFPDAFYMYLEDVDLAWRLRLGGWRTALARRAVIHHDYSASSIEGSAFKRRLLARNRIWLIARCFPSPVLRDVWLEIVQYDLLSLIYGAARLDSALIAGRFAALRGLRSRLRERKAIQSAASIDPDELSIWLRPSPSPREILRLRRIAARNASGLENRP